MKLVKLTTLTAAMAMTGMTFSALAAESATLNIKGTVIPASCNVTVTGDVDYGSLQIAELQAAGETNGGYQLGEKSSGFNIACAGSTKVALSFKADSQPASVPAMTPVMSGISEYTVSKLGVLGQAGGKDVGYYAIISPAASHINVDDEEQYPLKSLTNGVSWTSPTGNTAYDLSGTNIYSWGGASGNPVAGKNISGNFKVVAVINPDVANSVTEETKFDANTTLTVRYL